VTRADSLAAGWWAAAVDTPGWELVSGWPAAGCCSLCRPPEELWAASMTSSRQCCNCVLHVFQMSHQDVASVLCGCCKSRSRCFNVANVDPSTQHFDSRCCNYLFSNVANVAIICFRMLRMLQLFFNIFSMLRMLSLDVIGMLGVVSRGRRAPDVECCNH
jgi:hypothetical protein